MRKWFFVPLCAAGLAGCAYAGGDVANPVARSATWFSYVEGGDLRATCGPGAPDRYRMVYNAVYGEQVRLYELGDGADPRHLFQHVFGGANLAGGVTLADPLQPWRGRGVEITLTAEQRGALVDALATSGAFGPPNVGLNLPSRGFWWSVAACHQGRYSFNAWLWPSPGFDALRFDDMLFALDRTGVPVALPRPVPPRYHDPRGPVDFDLRVGERGLWGSAAF